MSELQTLRDHAREMAEATEVPRPDVIGKWCRTIDLPVWHPDHDRGIEPVHRNCEPGGSSPAWRRCGCSCHDADRPAEPTEAERKLWRQIADEVGAYLAPDDEQEALL